MKFILYTVFICFLLGYFITPAIVKVPKKKTERERARALRKFLKNKQNLWEQSGQYQGDIIAIRPMNRNALKSISNYWPNKEIPYEISESFTQENKEIIKKSLAYLSNKTCIVTRPRQDGDVGSIFISHKSGHGCSSNIGYWGMRQIVYLDQVLGCVQFGVVVHELVHIVGLWHQQSAHNRDRYLDILWENVAPGLEHNFNKADDDTTSFGYRYDFNSIMHYTAYAFSKNGKKTIVPKNKNDGAHMGQRQRLSVIDIAKIRSMYKC